MVWCMSREVESDAGHVANVEYFVRLEEVVECVLDFLSWDLVFLCEVTLDNSDILTNADLCVRLTAGPESLLNIVGR